MITQEFPEKCEACGYRIYTVTVHREDTGSVHIVLTGHVICPQCKAELALGPQARTPAAAMVDREEWKEG